MLELILHGFSTFCFLLVLFSSFGGVIKSVKVTFMHIKSIFMHIFFVLLQVLTKLFDIQALRYHLEFDWMAYHKNEARGIFVKITNLDVTWH